VVRELSKAFDHYWNSTVVYPVQAIAGTSLSPEQLRQRFDQVTAGARPPRAVEVVNGGAGPIPEGYPTRDEVPEGIIPMLNLPYELARGHISPLVPASARVLFDPASKTTGANERANSFSGTVLGGAVEWLKTARQQVRMVSPYFVPSESSVAAIATARKFGVQLDIITNSLAATDEPWVYVGYSRRVKELLALGVRIHEMSPSLSVKRRRIGVFGQHTSGALHTKNAIVDRAQVFLGSMNLDPRSALLNTELGLIIESPQLARQLEGMSDAGSFYDLRLSPDGQDVLWVEHTDGGGEIVYDSPPETSWWLRFRLRLLAPFIPEREL
jgi:putative cardiolipin synthase